MEKEAKVMRYLAERGYLAPRVEELSGDGAELIMERISGPTMLEALSRQPWTFHRHACALAALHQRLHEISGPEWLVSFPGGGECLIHLDLHPLNVILSPRGPVVVDWATAARTARYYYYPGWHEPGLVLDFGFNKKAYEALPVDLRRTLDHATAAVQVYDRMDFHPKNALALEQLRTEFKGKVEILQLPVPVLRDLRKLAAEVVREESEKTPMTRKVHASFTKFQALVGPWDHVAEGAYHQFVAV